MLLPFLERKIVERKLRMEKIGKFLKKGKETTTLDLGCKDGSTTRALQLLTGGKVIGLEKSQTSISEAKKGGFSKFIDFVHSDFMNFSSKKTFDQLIASYFFHEIYSIYGRSGFNNALSKCVKLIKPGGKLIIIDGVHPTGSSTITFKNKVCENQFAKFLKEYKIAEGTMIKKQEERITVDNAKFSRFLNLLKFILPADLARLERTIKSSTNRKETAAKAFYILDYYAMPRKDYPEEFLQDFVFNSRLDWVSAIESAGFEIEKTVQFNERKIEEFFWKSNIGMKTVPKIHLLIVAKKTGKG